MGMVVNKIGLILADSGKTKHSCTIWLADEVTPELTAEVRHFKGITDKELILKAVEKCFKTEFGGSFASIVKYDDTGKEFQKFKTLVLDGNDPHYLFLYTTTEFNGYTQLDWFKFDFSENSGISGVERVAGGSLPERIALLEESDASGKSNLVIDGTYVLLDNADKEFIEKVKAYQSVKISKNKLRIQFPVSSDMALISQGTAVTIKTDSCVETVNLAWSSLLQNSGLFDYADWDKKRNKYYKAHPYKYDPNAVPIPPEEHPGESCVLLEARKYSLEDSILKLAEVIDQCYDWLRICADQVPRKKNGMLMINRSVSAPFELTQSILLYPRRMISFDVKAVGDDEINARMSII